MQLVTGQRTDRQADLAPPAEFHTPAEDIVSPPFDFVQQSAVDPEHRLQDRLAGRVEVIVEGFRPRVILTRAGDFELHETLESTVAAPRGAVTGSGISRRQFLGAHLEAVEIFTGQV